MRVVFATGEMRGERLRLRVSRVERVERVEVFNAETQRRVSPRRSLSAKRSRGEYAEAVR